MVQLEMIERVRALADADARIAAVLMYGSFIRDEGDRWSDIEFYLFYKSEFDHREWVGGVRPVELFFTNEFGTEVAVFDNLVRGEFHFLPVGEIGVIRTWEGHISFRDYRRMQLVDKEGLLGEQLAAVGKETPPFGGPESVRWIAESALNHLLMVRGLIERGEAVHAQTHFQYILKHLLWLIRVDSRAFEHWEGPSKMAEKDLPPAWYRRYVRCVPDARIDNLRRCWNETAEALEELFPRCGVPRDLSDLLAKIKTRL